MHEDRILMMNSKIYYELMKNLIIYSKYRKELTIRQGL